jgi:hypothetical protein
MMEIKKINSFSLISSGFYHDLDYYNFKNTLLINLKNFKVKIKETFSCKDADGNYVCIITTDGMVHDHKLTITINSEGEISYFLQTFDPVTTGKWIDGKSHSFIPLDIWNEEFPNIMEAIK